MGAFSKCAECRVCCGRPGGARITQEEAWILHGIRPETRFMKIDENLYEIQSSDGKCPFLAPDGCALNDADKPLSCEIWPFLPARGGWIMRMSCPYWNTITEDEFEHIKKVFEAKKHMWVNVANVWVE